MTDDRSPNWVDKTIWTGDNLQVMRGMNSGTVDLIYLDPPFNSKKNYAAPVGSQAAGSAFKDTWTLSDIDVEWLNLIEEKHPALWRVLMAAPTPSDKSYLVYMAPRLLEMKRLLRRSGSIYLHCDPRMSHYLKLVMDAVFGRKAFRNEVVWRRTKGRSDGNRWGRVHDVILLYTTGPKWTWNRQYLPLDLDYVKDQYRHVGEHGHWQSGDLTASGTRQGESGQPWRGIDPTDKGRHWNTPTQGGMNTWIIEQNLIPGWPDAHPSVHSRLDALDDAGLVHWTKDGRGTPRLKRYLESTRGRAVPDMFLDIGKLEDSAPEKIGLPHPKTALSPGADRQGILRSRRCRIRSVLWLRYHPRGRRRPGPSVGGDRHLRRKPPIWSWNASGNVRDCSGTSCTARTSRAAPTWGSCPRTTARRTVGRCTGCRRATAPDATPTSSCGTWIRTTSSPSRRAAPTIWTTCNCCAVIAIGRKETGAWNTLT